MTETELMELSKLVSQKYVIPKVRQDIAYYKEYDETTLHDVEYCDIWLHNDSTRCFELLVKHRLNLHNYNTCVEVSNDDDVFAVEYLSNYNGDGIIASCVAILKLLEKM